MGQLPHILPDYMLVFAVPVLAHDPAFTRWDDITELTRARACLWFILEPLMMKNDYYCFSFYKNLIERMKNHKDAVKGNDDSVNYVSFFFVTSFFHSDKDYILIVVFSFRNCGRFVIWL